MSENDQIQRQVQQFIKENQATYTRDAITRKLLDAGYSIHEIDAGFEALGIGWEGAQKEKMKNYADLKYGDWRLANTNPLGFLIFFPGVPILMYFVAFVEPGLSGLLYLATILAGFFIPMFIKNNDPDLAKGMIYGFRTFLVLFFCFPIVAVGVLWGICMAGGGMY